MESQLNDIVEANAEEWKLKDRTVKAISMAKGDKKVSAFASAIRTMQFMQRYESELQQRDDRLRVRLTGVLGTWMSDRGLRYMDECQGSWVHGCS